MKTQDYINIEEIKKEIHRAVNSGDFKNLQQQLTDTMNGVVKEAGKYLGEAGKHVNESVSDAFRQPAKTVPQKENAKAFLVKTRPVGKVASVLYTVFGSIGLGACIIGFFATGITMLVLGFQPMGHSVALWILGGLLVISGLLLSAGGKWRGRWKRLQRYLKVMQGKTYCAITDMASYSQKSVAFVRKDLSKMIQLGMLPEGHLDERGTCFMADDETFGQYLSTQKALQQRESLKEVKPVSEQQPEEPRQKNSQLDAIIEEGRQYMEKLREINDAIPGEVISDKLYRLEHLTAQIFQAVEKRPGQQGRLQKMMDYYLPTTLKLVAAYQEFDSVSFQGENIDGAKAEIEKTLDAINLAFEKLLDDLYRDAAFDVTTDAAVLQTILAKEGLAESDFKEGK